jgi:hypothetical protein
VQTTTQITEVYASTRAYPAWWSDLEESRILRRRKSLGDSVLERNLCFVDTPGYGNKTSVRAPDIVCLILANSYSVWSPSPQSLTISNPSFRKLVACEI